MRATEDFFFILIIMKTASMNLAKYHFPNSPNFYSLENVLKILEMCKTLGEITTCFYII